MILELLIPVLERVEGLAGENQGKATETFKPLKKLKRLIIPNPKLCV